METQAYATSRLPLCSQEGYTAQQRQEYVLPRAWYFCDMTPAWCSATLPPKTCNGAFAAQRHRRSRACGALVCLLLLGPVRASSTPRVRRRVGGEVSFQGGKSVAGFVARPAVPRRSNTRGRVGDSSKRVESRKRPRSSRVRGTASMAVSAGLDAETINQQSRWGVDEGGLHPD